MWDACAKGKILIANEGNAGRILRVKLVGIFDRILARTKNRSVKSSLYLVIIPLNFALCTDPTHENR